MEPIELEKSRVENEPYIVWNAFIDIIAGNPDELTDVQWVAHCAFWYDSEVQNGGHLQFFENTFNRYKGKEDKAISATMEALKIIGAKKQGEILSKASKQYFSQKRKHPSTVEEFVELELEDEFEESDHRYYDCSQDMNFYLEKYLQTYLNEFVRII